MGQISYILLGLECHLWHMRNGINVIEYFKPGEYSHTKQTEHSDTIQPAYKALNS